jgi:hypothetical protein
MKILNMCIPFCWDINNNNQNTTFLNIDLVSNMFKPHGVIIRLLTKTY